MNTPRYAAAAAKLLGRHLPVPKPQAGEHELERGVATIERAMLARSRRRGLASVAGALAAAAALALLTRSLLFAPVNDRQQSPLVAIDVSPAGKGAALRASDRASQLAGRAGLQSGQRIETPVDGGASLRFSTGTSVDLGGSTSFGVDSQGATERFSLQRGTLSAHVAKLTLGQRFIVATPDAEVEVRGTRFTVRVLEQGQGCGAGSRTRLDVVEGVVEVRSGGASVSVHAGEHWPSGCAVTAPQLVQLAPPSSVAATAASESAHVARPDPKALAANAARSSPWAAEGTAPSTPSSEKASALAAQNDLFAQGVASRRQGDVNGALRAYQDLIDRFPSSPLAENAMVERMRLLASVHDARASAEAQRYLARYPRGFAVHEAGALAERP